MPLPDESKASSASSLIARFQQQINESQKDPLPANLPTPLSRSGSLSSQRTSVILPSIPSSSPSPELPIKQLQDVKLDPSPEPLLQEPSIEDPPSRASVSPLPFRQAKQPVASKPKPISAVKPRPASTTPKKTITKSASSTSSFASPSPSTARARRSITPTVSPPALKPPSKVGFGTSAPPRIRSDSTISSASGSRTSLSPEKTVKPASFGQTSSSSVPKTGAPRTSSSVDKAPSSKASTAKPNPPGSTKIATIVKKAAPATADSQAGLPQTVTPRAAVALSRARIGRPGAALNKNATAPIVSTKTGLRRQDPHITTKPAINDTKKAPVAKQSKDAPFQDIEIESKTATSDVPTGHPSASEQEAVPDEVPDMTDDDQTNSSMISPQMSGSNSVASHAETESSMPTTEDFERSNAPSPTSQLKEDGKDNGNTTPVVVQISQEFTDRWGARDGIEKSRSPTPSTLANATEKKVPIWMQKQAY